MSTPSNIFLIGPMGAGKSTIGKRLAQMLKADFIDSDREIENHTGADIPLIFELEGEAGFRQRESHILNELTQRSNIVLATGGGSVLLPVNQQILKERGSVVYLHTTVQQQLQRTRRDQNRPLLQTADPEKKLRELFETRDPIYRQLATITINTDGRSIHSVSQEIIKKLDLMPTNKGQQDPAN